MIPLNCRQVAALLLVLLLAACGSEAPTAPVASSPAQPTASSPARLGHAGRWLIDNQGRIVILHGVNMVSKLPPYTPEAAGFGEDDAALLEEQGFNVVRVGIIYAGLEPAPGQYDVAYLASIQRTVALLASHGIGSLLDMHQDLFGAPFTGEGFPTWAVFTDGLPALPNVGFPDNYFVMTGLQRAFDNFWSNRPVGSTGLQDRYAAAWAYVAARFRDQPGVVGYDIINEPFPGSSWRDSYRPDGSPAFDREVLTPFESKVIAAIRTEDSQTMVFCEPEIFFGLGSDTHLGAFDDPRVGLSFHNYQPPFSQILNNAERYSQRTGAALFMTEWGATTDAAVINTVATLADQQRMPWIYWAYANKTPFFISSGNSLPGTPEQQGLVLDPTRPLLPGNVQENLLSAVARPYPRAIAGVPVSWSFDPTSRSFELVYTSGPGERTEVVLPRPRYPGGYRVEASGARVTSEPGAPVLWLANAAATAEVRVRVTP